MDELHNFARVFRCVVIATLAPVIFTAFVCIPVALEHHPGESQTQAAASPTATPAPRS